MSKKSLDEILRVSWRITTTSNKSVERWPVRFTKTSECLSRDLISISLVGQQHDGPMRRFERRATLLQRSRNRFRKSSMRARKGFTTENATSYRCVAKKNFTLLGGWQNCGM